MTTLKLSILRVKHWLDAHLPVSPRTVRLRDRLRELLDESRDYRLWLARNHGSRVVFGITGSSRRDPLQTRGRELRGLIAQLEDERKHWNPRPVILLKSRASEELFAALAGEHLEQQARKARRTI